MTRLSSAASDTSERPAGAGRQGDELQTFADDDLFVTTETGKSPASCLQAPAQPPWRILIVDDDDGIHQATLLALGLLRFRGRPFQFLSAHSAAEACALLSSTPDIALVLLDVVMETEDAGLRLVRTIREDLNNHLARIVLRTGQPGLAPQQQVIVDYDIDDYKNKAELTGAKLFSTVVCALRAYDNLRAMAEQQAALRASLKTVQNLELALNEHAIVAVTERDGRLRTVNDKFCRLACASSETLLNSHHAPLLERATTLGRAGLSLGQCLAEGRVWQGELSHVQPDGTQRWAETTVVPFLDEHGHHTHSVAVATDVTEARLARQQILELNHDLELRVQRRTNELEEAKQVAEAANHAKSIFLANMSHEIRTPLNAVLGYAQLLSRDPQLPQSLRSIVVPIEKAGAHLLTLINDILDLSKIEAGGMSLDSVEMDLGALASEMGDLFALRCAQRGIGWRCELQLPTPCVLRGDAGKLRQVLLNLLSNAVKFTDCGEVLLRIRVLGEAAPDTPSLRLEFEVSDTGLGIPEAQQALVFAPFHQAEAGEQRGGTGLGLAISSRQVELMGGRLQLQSREGQGSRFSFCLQLARSDGGSLLQDSGFGALLSLSEGRALSALVVDDIEANRDVLTRMLQGLGAQVQQAENGLQALQLLQDQRFDIVFLDIRMPVLDGMATLKRLRSELPRPQPVVVALTASALSHERETYMSAGFDDFIGKPFLFETVHQLLRRHLGPLFASGNTASDSQQKQELEPISVSAALLAQLQAAVQTGWISELERGIECLLQASPAEQALGERLLAGLRQYDMASLQRELQTVHAAELPA